MLIAQVCDFGNDGDARYRVHDPSRALGGLPGVTAVDCHFLSRFLPELIERADVLVLQFVMDWEMTGVCLRRRAAGKVTVFEANDYFFDLQPWNPIAGPWQDPAVQELYLQLLKLADGVQTSTPELARRWKRLGARNVAVFPNQLTSVPELSPAPQDRPLTIGWAGSPGHLADLYHLAPCLQGWLDAHPDVHLAVMTTEAARPFFNLPPDHYHFETFGSLDSYLQFLRRLDIGLAPLLPTDYNRCRSDVKFLEYASQGVVGIFADLEPYRESVGYKKTGLLYRDSPDLIAHLEGLRTDRDLRLALRQQGHAYVRRNRVLSNHIASRLSWYQGLLPKHDSNSSLPAEIAAHAVRDGGYLRLPPQEPERGLRDVMSTSAPAQASPALARLLEQSPQYLSALQHQGRLLNDLRQHRQALEVLERSRAIQPQSARTLAEIGRAWYRLNDDARALAALDHAITFNPHYLPAWQYLLRMLSVNQDADGPRRAEEAAKIFPTCYPVALLSVAAYPRERAPSIILEVLDRFGSSLDSNSRPAALSAFREAVLATVKAIPDSPELLPLLARASELFPESPRLVAAYGAALIAAGRDREGWEQHRRALALFRGATVAQDEFQNERTTPLPWELASHILKAGGE
jgi:tetratricopeptide (TPR) repeat protein